MNDVIMASVAALKSQSDKTQFSLYTGFRSVRRTSQTDRMDADGPVTVSMNSQTRAFYERHSDNPQNLMRKVLEDHARQHAVAAKGLAQL